VSRTGPRRRLPSRATVLCVALALALLPGGCSRAPRTGATLVRDSALASLPRDSTALLVLEIKTLKTLSGYGRFMTDMARVTEEQGALKELKERLGSETLDRIDRLGLAVVPLPAGKAGYAILAEGRMEEAKLREAFGGQDSLNLNAGPDNQDVSLMILPGGALLLGPKTILDQARAGAGQAGKGLDGNNALLDLLARVRPTAHLWGAVDFRSIMRQARQSSETLGSSAANALPAGGPTEALIGLGFQGEVGKGLTLDLMGKADGEAGAKKLADAARGLVALGRMGARPDQAADWVAFLDSVTINPKGSDIDLHAVLPEAMLDTLAEQARNSGGAAPASPAVGPAKPAATAQPPGAPRSAAIPQPTMNPRPAAVPHPAATTRPTVVPQPAATP